MTFRAVLPCGILMRLFKEPLLPSVGQVHTFCNLLLNLWVSLLAGFQSSEFKLHVHRAKSSIFKIIKNNGGIFMESFVSKYESQLYLTYLKGKL